MDNLIEAIATAGTLIGFWLVSQAQIIPGFSLMAVSNLAWLAWSYRKNAKGVFLTNIVLFFTSLNGLGVI